MLYTLSSLFNGLYSLTGMKAFYDISKSLNSADRTTRQIQRTKEDAKRVYDKADEAKDKLKTGTGN